MEEQREEIEFVVDDFRAPPMHEAGQGLGLSSQIETLDGDVDGDVTHNESCIEVANTVEVSELGVSDVSDGGLATCDLVSDEKQVKAEFGSVEESTEKIIISASDDVENTDAITEPERDSGTVEVKPVDQIVGSEPVDDFELKDEMPLSEDKSKNVASHESAEEGEIITSDGNEVTDEKVEDQDGALDLEKESIKTSETNNSKIDVDCKQENKDKVGVSYNEQGNSDADQEKESSEEYNNIMDVDNKQATEEYETTDTKHSESAQDTEEYIQLGKGETNKESIEAVSEFNSTAEISHVEETSKVNQKEEIAEAMETDYAGNGSTVASMVQTQDVPIAEADRNDSNVGNVMEMDERKDTAMASDVTGTIESADSANRNSSAAAPGEVEPLDHNALFDPSSDVTNLIDFSGEGTRNESSEVCVAFEAEASAAATDCPEEAFGHDCLDEKRADQQNTVREEDDITHEAPSIDPNQKEDTEMEENPDNSDYADDGTALKTNGVKRKADVLSEDSPGEGTKTVSLAKVSFAERPSFKIGACIARAANQMAGSPSVLKGSNFGDETLSVESFVSQLHCAAMDPVKENSVSDIAVGFFLDFRNSLASQHVTPETVNNKRVETSNFDAGGTETFEFQEMDDTYWTDRMIHNGGEEQTPPTENGNNQIVQVESKPVQVQRTRRPYRRRQSQINVPLPESKPVIFDENAPAELIMKFSESDTIPPETSLSKMFRRFGPIRESQTEVDSENNRARVVFKKGGDAKVAYNSAGSFNIFGKKTVNYELSDTITETFKVQPYVVCLGEEDAALYLPSSV